MYEPVPDCLFFHTYPCPPAGVIGWIIGSLNSLVMVFGFRNSKWDVVYCPNHLFQTVLVSILATKLSKSKMICWVRHTIPKPSERRAYKGFGFFELVNNLLIYSSQLLAVRLINKYADVIFSYTNTVVDKMKSLGIRPDKVRLVRNGVDFYRIDAVEAGGQEFYDACNVGANLGPRKGLVDLIKSWRIVCDTISDAKLVIIGRFRQWQNLANNLIADLKLTDNVVLASEISDSMKISIFKRSRIFVFPSYEEGWSQSISEALACGLPVVSYHIPELVEIYGNLLSLVPAGDAAGLGAKEIALLVNPENQPDKVEERKEFARMHLWEKVAAEQLQLINRVVQPRTV